MQTQNPLILGLHRMGRPKPGQGYRGLFTTPRLLDWIIRGLKANGYTFQTLEESLKRPANKPAVLTFDDGYVDNFTLARPVLRRHRIPATVFVITSDVGSTGVVWDEAGAKDPADLMGWDHLSTLQNEGWEIGSHAAHHIHLDRQSYRAQFDSIQHSVAQIEKELGVKPTSFCYPYGAYNADTQKVLASLNFRSGLTSEFPTRHASGFDPLALQRVHLWGRNPDHYALMAARIIRGARKLKERERNRVSPWLGIPIRNVLREMNAEERFRPDHASTT